MKLSKNLTLQEAITSQTAERKGLNNHPDQSTINVMKLTAEKVFQPVRDYFDKPIRVSSFYRSPQVNKAVGGSATSQHRTGEAIDMQGTNGLTNAEIFEWIRKNLEFDQLIWEYGNSTEPAWVHVSYTAKRKNRKMVFAIGVKKNFK